MHDDQGLNNGSEHRSSTLAKVKHGVQAVTDGRYDRNVCLDHEPDIEVREPDDDDGS